MPFFQDIAWWLLSAGALLAASLPTFIKPFRMIPFAISTFLWAAAAAFAWHRFDTTAALATILFSLGGGMLIFLLTIFFSGLDLMAKKRYR